MATSRLGHCSGNEVVRKIIIGLLAVGFVGFGLGEWRSLAADEAPASGASSATPAAAGGAQPGGPMLGPATPPLDLVASTPKGQLKNPYNADIAAIAEEGHHRYLSAGCNGCHGGGGGGGMCPPLTNDTWVYGAGDDTLFRLVALGSDALQKQGYTRVKHEVVVGPMPPFGAIIKTSDDLWRIIAFIRSVNPDSLKHAGDSYTPPPQY
jgi:mono/diheme cytochrome c family protein